MNKKKWDSLDVAQKAFLNELLQDYEVKTYAAQISLQDEITRKLLEGGMGVEIYEIVEGFKQGMAETLSEEELDRVAGGTRCTGGYL